MTHGGARGQASGGGSRDAFVSGAQHGFAAGQIPKVPLNLTLLKGCQIMGVFWGAMAARDPKHAADSMQQLLDMVAAGKLKPYVSEHFKLDDAGKAIRLLMDRKAKGKVVVMV